jgi:glycosyltransferase involved in cell wall biosynthesis
MRILAIVHGYPPVQNAGAEWMLHEVLSYLVKQGHYCEVAMPKATEYTFDGVVVKDDSDIRGKVGRSELVISHLKQAGRSINVCEYYNKSYVQIIHNSNYYGYLSSKHREKASRFAYVVYNTEHIKKEMNYPNPSIVVHPPVDPSRCKTKKGTKITLINLFERKGGKFFHELAKLMPDYEFLGVEGGYGNQEKSTLPNVKYMSNTSDVKKIYSQTRILLMPSMYESYGIVGIEAMMSGIPVIASPTPGLKESLSTAGIFCQLDSPLKWVEAIKKLDDLEYYKKASSSCVERAKDVEKAVNKELVNMESFFQDIIEKRV